MKIFTQLVFMSGAIAQEQLAQSLSLDSKRLETEACEKVNSEIRATEIAAQDDKVRTA